MLLECQSWSRRRPTQRRRRSYLQRQSTVGPMQFFSLLYCSSKRAEQSSQASRIKIYTKFPFLHLTQILPFPFYHFTLYQAIHQQQEFCHIWRHIMHLLLFHQKLSSMLQSGKAFIFAPDRLLLLDYCNPAFFLPSSREINFFSCFLVMKCFILVGFIVEKVEIFRQHLFIGLSPALLLLAFPSDCSNDSRENCAVNALFLSSSVAFGSRTNSSSQGGIIVLRSIMS